MITPSPWGTVFDDDPLFIRVVLMCHQRSMIFVSFASLYERVLLLLLLLLLLLVPVLLVLVRVAFKIVVGNVESTHQDRYTGTHTRFVLTGSTFMFQVIGGPRGTLYPRAQCRKTRFAPVV